MAKTTNNETTLQRLSDNFLQKLDAYRLRPDNIHSKELDKARKKLDEFIAHYYYTFPDAPRERQAEPKAPEVRR